MEILWLLSGGALVFIGVVIGAAVRGMGNTEKK